MTHKFGYIHSRYHRRPKPNQAPPFPEHNLRKSKPEVCIPLAVKNTLHEAVLFFSQFLVDPDIGPLVSPPPSAVVMEKLVDLSSFSLAKNSPLHSKMKRIHRLAFELWDLERKETTDPESFDRSLLSMAIGMQSNRALRVAVDYFIRDLDLARAKLLVDNQDALSKPERVYAQVMLRYYGYGHLLHSASLPHGQPQDDISPPYPSESPYSHPVDLSSQPSSVPSSSP